MPDDRADILKRVALDAVGSGWVVLPALAGATAFVATGIGMVDTPLSAAAMVMAGAAGLLVGAGSAVTRWLTGAERVATRMMAEEKAFAAAERRARIAALNERLRKDGALWTNRALAGLLDLEQRVEAAEAAGGTGVPEVTDRMRELVTASIRSLERSATLHEAGQRLVTAEARAELAAERQKLLAEVQASINRVVTTLDRLAVMTARGEAGTGADTEPAAELQRLRNDLDASLDVARRVGDRMAEVTEQVRVGG